MRRSEARQVNDVLQKLAISGDRLTNFRPNPGGQEKFFKALKTKKEIILSGANDTGKSYVGTIACAMHIVPERDINGQKTGYQINPYKRIKTPPEGTLGMISTWSDKSQQNTLQPLIEMIFAKYITSAKKEGGAYHYLETEGGRIDFFWQQQGVEAYRGPKKHFAYMDEPHKQSIYREVRARLNKYGGSSWNTLTPVIDPDSLATIRDLQWMADRVIKPYEADPSSRPQLEVIYMDLDENPYHDSDSIREANLGMSEQERMAREHGRFIIYITGSKFDQNMVSTLRDYVIAHPEICTPQYGRLEYDPQENKKENQIQFWESPNKEPFPEKPEPEDRWVTKIWEHPIKNQLGIQPDYYIGADASGDKRGDYSCVYVKRADTRATVACLHGYIDQIELAKQIWLLGYYYSDDDGMPALMCLEGGSNNPGGVTLQYLITGFNSSFTEIQPYEWERIYHRPTISDLKNGVHIPSDDPGFYTSSGSRDFLVGNMVAYIAETYKQLTGQGFILIKDIGFLDEAEKFIQNKNGKFEAASGMTDDRLFASALCDMAMKQGVFRQQRIATEPEQDDSHFYVKDGLIYINNVEPKKEPKRAWV